MIQRNKKIFNQRLGAGRKNKGRSGDEGVSTSKKKSGQKENLPELKVNDKLRKIIYKDQLDKFKKEVQHKQHNKEEEMLMLASEKNAFKIAKYLIEQQKANVNVQDEEGFTPLHLAAQNDHDKVVKLLLKQKANVDVQDKEGFTPLHLAAQNGHDSMVKLLLEKGANVNAKTEKGVTPLYLAAQAGYNDVAKLLLVKGANVNAKAERGFTPLHLAAQAGHNDVAKLLLVEGANVNAEANKGIAPLHVAVVHGHYDVVELLLERGADFNAKVGGLAPLALALEHSRSKVIDLLLANPNANVGCIDLQSVSNEKADKGKLVCKSVQDRKLLNAVKQAGKEVDENKIEEIKDLLRPESEYGFKPSLNYSPDGNDENTTIKTAIKAGGKVLQLLCDYAKKHIGKDTKIFKQLERAKEQQENSQPKSDFCDVSVSGRLTQQSL